MKGEKSMSLKSLDKKKELVKGKIIVGIDPANGRRIRYE